MREKYVAALICFLIGVACIAWATLADAREFQLIELKELTVGYRDFLDGGYRPTLNGNGLENRTLGKEVNLFMNVDFGRYFFWNNRIHGASDEVVGTQGKGQFRDVGWQFWLGFRPLKILTVEYEHHSQHMLDHASPDRFPVEDSVGIKIHIFRDSKPSETLF